MYGGLRPNFKRLLKPSRVMRRQTDLALGNSTENMGTGVPTVSESSASIIAPAIGADVLVVNAGLPAGSVLVTGSYLEGVDYTIIYGAEVTYLHNLTITPGTALSVIYLQPDEEADGGGTAVDLAPPEFPVTATLLNSWVAFGAPFSPPAYYKDRDRCYLRGMAKNGAAAFGTILFTVPEAYRPSNDVRMLAAGAGGPVTLDAQADGDVLLVDAGFSVDAAWLSLEGCSWRLPTDYGFDTWGQTDITFGSGEMDVPYEALD